MTVIRLLDSTRRVRASTNLVALICTTSHSVKRKVNSFPDNKSQMYPGHDLDRASDVIVPVTVQFPIYDFL